MTPVLAPDWGHLYTSRGLECLRRWFRCVRHGGRGGCSLGEAVAKHRRSVPFHLVDYDGAIAARAIFGERFHSAWAQGSEMTMEQAVAYSLANPRVGHTSPELLGLRPVPGTCIAGRRAPPP